MISELQILNQLKKVIGEQLNEYLTADEENSGLLEEISEANVIIDFPDIDNMPKNTTIYIQPDYEEVEDLSVITDFTRMRLLIYIICKGAKSATLIKKVFGYYTALFMLIRNNQTLDGMVEFSKINSMDYYPSVTASSTMSAIEVGAEINWAKTF